MLLGLALLCRDDFDLPRAAVSMSTEGRLMKVYVTWLRRHLDTIRTYFCGREHLCIVGLNISVLVKNILDILELSSHRTF